MLQKWGTEICQIIKFDRRGWITLILIRTTSAVREKSRQTMNGYNGLWTEALFVEVHRASCRIAEKKESDEDVDKLLQLKTSKFIWGTGIPCCRSVVLSYSKRLNFKTHTTNIFFSKRSKIRLTRITRLHSPSNSVRYLINIGWINSARKRASIPTPSDITTTYPGK